MERFPGRVTRRWARGQVMIGAVVGSLITLVTVVAPASGERDGLTTTAGPVAAHPAGAASDGSGEAAGQPSAPTPAPDSAASGERARGAGPPAGGTGSDAGQVPARGPAVGGAVTGSSDGPDAGLTATDHGVTAATITLGFAILDVGSVGQFGVGVGIGVEQQIDAANVYVDDLNRRGGVNGRMVEPVFTTFDVVDSQAHAAACRRLVQDQGAFAVLAQGGFEPPGTLCVTQQFQRPLINVSNLNPDELYSKAEGLLVTVHPRGGRMMRNVAAEMADHGLARDRRVGVVFDKRGDPAGTTLATMVDALRQEGADVAHVTHLSGDPNTAASQVPVEVQRMQQKGVEVVFLAPTLLAAVQFVNQSESQFFSPEWVASDWGSLSGDTAGGQMPDGFEGAYNFTTTGQGAWRTPPYDVENEFQAECERIYEDATGHDIVWGDTDYGVTMFLCDMVEIFERAARAAGPDLTATSFASAVETIGAFGTSTFGGGAFGPGKTDLNDRFRTLRWTADCSCFNPTSDFRPARH